jgi:cell division protein FtsL
MLRFLNLLTILALLGSAGYAYTIKYQTSFRTEQIAKTKIEIKTEQDAVAVLRAEYSFLTRPERIQQLADRYLDLQAPTLDKLVAMRALPDRVAHADTIGAEIDQLGLGVPSTPAVDAGAAPTTPQPPKSAKTKTSASATPTGHAR